MSMTSFSERARRLRELVEAPDILVAPGAHDALSAVLAERAGFDALFLGDYNASAILLGKPDYGLVTLNEMVDIIRRITSVVSIPLIADSGCGFGNALNVMRTVQDYESAGASAITIEDQVFPKRCGHMEDKRIIPLEEMLGKIRAAVRARENPDVLIITRTDSIYTDGMDEAVRRGRAFAEAGADGFWADAVTTLADLARLVEEVPLPVLVAMIEGGKTPHSTTNQLQKTGVAIEVSGLTTLYAAAGGIRKALEALRKDGITTPVLRDMIVFQEFNELVGLPEMRKLEQEVVARR